MTTVWLALISAFKNILLKVVSEKFFTWAIFKLADLLVESTKTPHDDEWLAKIKELVEEGSKEDGKES